MKKAYIIWCSLMITIGSAGAESFPKWLAIGNSITKHGPLPELQWEGPARGMASSEQEKDYVHVLRRLIQKRDPASATELEITGRVGKLSAGTMEQMEANVAKLTEWGADLITIQLGENDHFKEIGAHDFEQRYRRLVDALMAGSKPPKIICTGVWAPVAKPVGQADKYPDDSEAAQKDRIIEKICNERELVFVPIAPIALNPANHGSGQVAGVKWHPNDAGMAAYAEAIAAALFSER